MRDPQRLDYFENELDTVKHLLISTAQYAESSDHKINRLIDRQDITQNQLDGLSLTVQAMGAKIDRFVDNASDFIDTTRARNAILDDVVLELRDSQNSTNAALERLEIILAKLMQRNEENNI
ncbi:hypothetical protein VB620_03525 [Nodularia harveyana UHCC-0300]|uniref:Uncharacterized protein n=1 Tax=Nodularia harveyana UHCC-0300 TaxID=2974287 RepID=A0ABU5UA61_9CYAN|nr:hypothetical protein [Nodularia harveyana]MEA5580409.1 hypothetical protein [Nodularia harveyana UHCC-0300]